MGLILVELVKNAAYELCPSINANLSEIYEPLCFCLLSNSS